LSGGYEHIETRQIHDVLIQKIISNHLIFAAKCNCSCVEKANSSIACGVSYGTGLKSILSYLGNYMLIPNERLSELSGSLFKSPLSEGTLQNWQVEISNKLTAYHEDMEDVLLKQALLHIDESGLKVNN
jgi:transposase